MSPENPSSLDFDIAVMLRGFDAENEAIEQAKQNAGQEPGVDAESLSAPITMGSTG